MVLASGTRVSLRYVKELVRGTTPAGVGTPVASVEAEATGAGGAGFSMFKRASGSWVTDGFAVGQTIRSAGFTNPTNNGDWVVAAVSATDLEVVDSGDIILDEVAGGGKTVTILLETLRATGRNINLEKNILESAEVRSSRQKFDVRHGFNRVVGSPGFELSTAAYDDFIEFVMANSWKRLVITGAPNLSTTAPSTITRAAGSFVTDGFRAGDLINTTDFSNGANNGTFRIATVGATTLTLVETTLQTESSGAGKSVDGGYRIDIGTSLITATIERAFEDVAQFEAFKGVAVDQMQLSISPEAIVGGTFNLLGMSAAALAGTSISALTPKAAAAFSPFAAFDGSIYEAAALIAVVTSLEFTLVNNRSLNPVVGSKFSPDVFEGQAIVTGTLAAYFENATLLNKFRNETESSIWLRLTDVAVANQWMNLVFPRVKYTGGSMDPPQEGPVPLSMPFQALEKTGLVNPGGVTGIATSLTIQRSNLV